ncbi:MAG: DUF177 domain-containing protein [Clostridiales bacterium]|nr:DUF177 domain-containing protein [Clostridiales bacterium]
MQCGYCLEEYEEQIDFLFKIRLFKEENKFGDPDIVLFEGDKINLTEIIQDFILSELPILRRCSDLCKGICSGCGVNLNKNECQCVNFNEMIPEDSLIERLQQLKDLFSKDNKEV